MKIEWLDYPERIEILEPFMNDWPGFWRDYFDDPACDQIIAQRTVKIRNDLSTEIAKAKSHLAKMRIAQKRQ